MFALESDSLLKVDRMFSVDRVSRQGDKFLGRLRMNKETLAELRKDRIGLLFEKFLRLETMLGRVVQFAKQKSFGRIVVVYPTREAGASAHNLIAEMGLIARTAKTPTTWTLGTLIFTSIEALPTLRVKEDGSNQVSGISMIILLDPMCMVYKARSMYFGNGYCHDRPQIISNALCDLANDGLEPLFSMMTCKTAVALNTEKLARTYGRETWWFCDGPTTKIGTPTEFIR